MEPVPRSGSKRWRNYSGRARSRGSKIGNAVQARNRIYRQWQDQAKPRATLKRSKRLSRKTPLKARKPIFKPKTLDEILWELVRQYVLARDGFKCCKCGGRQRVSNPGSVLQGAHIYPKGTYRSMKYEVDNVLTLCWTCHLGPRGWHKHPLEAAEWIREHLAPERLARLKLLSQTPRKTDKQGIKIYLEMELAKMGTENASELMAWRRP